MRRGSWWRSRRKRKGRKVSRRKRRGRWRRSRRKRR